MKDNNSLRRYTSNAQTRFLHRTTPTAQIHSSTAFSRSFVRLLDRSKDSYLHLPPPSFKDPNRDIHASLHCTKSSFHANPIQSNPIQSIYPRLPSPPPPPSLTPPPQKKPRQFRHPLHSGDATPNRIRPTLRAKHGKPPHIAPGPGSETARFHQVLPKNRHPIHALFTLLFSIRAVLTNHSICGRYTPQQQQQQQQWIVPRKLGLVPRKQY